MGRRKPPRGNGPRPPRDTGDIEGLDGDGLPNPCPVCGKHSTQAGKPSFTTQLVGYRCPFCSAHWTREIEPSLYDDDIVRVDLDGGYIYGGVVRIDGDRVLVWPDDPPGPRQWFDLWRVIVY